MTSKNNIEYVDLTAKIRPQFHNMEAAKDTKIKNYCICIWQNRTCLEKCQIVGQKRVKINVCAPTENRSK